MSSGGMASIAHPTMAMSMGIPVGMHTRELHDNQGFEGDSKRIYFNSMNSMLIFTPFFSPRYPYR